MRRLILALSCLPAMVRAEVPAVAVDIAPVHSLVSRVMQGVGTPDLMIPPGASPHGYAMRPSEARSLSGADLVVWIGPELTPWLEEPLDALAPNASKLSLMDARGMSHLVFREGVTFDETEHEGDDHDDHAEDEGGHDDHAHADEGHEDEAHDHEEHHEEGHDEAAHDEEAHHDDGDDEAGHDDHAHDEEGHEDHAQDAHGHDHSAGGRDPHIWLDPVNAAVALDAIAEALTALDPENAAIYRQNAQQGRADLEALTQQVTTRLSAVNGQPFIVFHDAFHYFEARFDVEAVAAISTGDAAAPGPARISALRAQVAKAAPVCAFTEPQMNTALMQTVLEGQETALATLDPLGASLALGANLYGELIMSMATAMEECLDR